QHDTQLWVLNLPTKTERSSNGTQWTEVSRQSYYNASTSMSLLPYQSRSYGVLQRTQTHHGNGLLKRESWNVANRFVEFNNYVRGIPTSITLPQRYGSGVVSASQTVNARGEVTAVTNFKGATT
ncbi:hypothetical protein, partial [Pseudidiomarina atlantica]|uniref:hypothetical protein n=1 Tax=Pseudidiomarina atlantica TaxID=1517416 RepID=UPI00055708E4